MAIIIMTVIESFTLEVISPFLQSRSSSMRGLISSSLNSISFKFFPLYRVISPFSANTRNLEILVFSISDDRLLEIAGVVLIFFCGWPFGPVKISLESNLETVPSAEFQTQPVCPFY